MYDQSIIDRFWSKVDVRGGDECWEWKAYINTTGYGQFGTIGRSLRGAHRVSWQIANGDIPEGLLVCHKCDNRKCVNPGHLFLGTYMDNAQDAMNKGRTVPPPRMVGEDHSMAKITEDTVRSIRFDYDTGLRQIDLVRKYGLSKSQINRIVRRMSWGHL